MIHRMLRYPAGWEWHVVQQARYESLDQQPLPSRKSAARGDDSSALTRTKPKPSMSETQVQAEEHITELKREFPECAVWLDECQGRRMNHIYVDDQPEIGPILCGTLMIQVTEDQSDVQPFHFWLSRSRLITMHEDMRIPLRLQSGTHTLKYEESQIAPEAFFIMISVLLETFHIGLDGFERRLGELEKTMRKRNQTGLLDVIFERRYDLLHWSHLFIPIREMYGAAKETFTDDLEEKEAFIRITHKLERIESLLKHYALEIDTLISMDDAISSFRGNDIMKTLTIFTVLFLPATIAGSLMGSNFDKLPYKNHPWGFIAMVIVIFAITIGIYIWLYKKGWTGDLLNKKGGPVLLSESDSDVQEGRSRLHGKRKKPSKRSQTAASSDASQPNALRSRKNRV
ncbi:magnesium transporter [Paenibacillus sp. 1011MAR3C5]|uniref:magnesium transporter CorA family protein n=1 Tax=Paenibacillus sp. 1011MAR3C5 TaxID=1675787 RepID=UPI000E6CF9F0|nr:magnesium transporter CorA family protein [Paenibacillus sp. 1011MAR3C5]RJE87645.1 magnesium transporter [Paenibacillus sp. 1011MAR3C5]